MAREQLRIELTAKEREEWWAGEAVTFSVSDEGHVTVGEDWGKMDELWGDGCSVTIPARIWREAAPWIEAQVRALVT